MGTSSSVELGPGLLYVAPIGTTEPTSASAALDAAFVEVGYTDDGSRFTWTTNIEGIEVEEEFEPIRYATVGRVGMLAFAAAELTRRNLGVAINAGVATSSAVALEPPAPGLEVRVKIVWTSDPQGPSLTASRWIYRQCFQGGDMEINRQKAPDKALLPMEFSLEKPTSLTAWKVFPNADGLI